MNYIAENWTKILICRVNIFDKFELLNNLSNNAQVHEVNIKSISALSEPLSDSTNKVKL